MRIGFSCGWTDEYWRGWPWTKQYGGSEHILVELAAEMAAQGHEVSVRLPRDIHERAWRGVRWRGLHASGERPDILFCFDDYERRDRGVRTFLVACRSDTPKHTDFDELIFLSATHAALLGHAGRPYIGGGVSLSDYKETKERIPNRVIYTSSPDRGLYHARVIGKSFDFKATYKPIPVFGKSEEMTREDLIALQQAAMVQIHPCDPIVPAELFCMSILEAMAAGTPCVISDADALPEVWGDSAVVLPRPIDYGVWHEEIERLMRPKRWAKWSELGKRKAQQYDWSVVAQTYLSV